MAKLSVSATRVGGVECGIGLEVWRTGFTWRCGARDRIGAVVCGKGLEVWCMR